MCHDSVICFLKIYDEPKIMVDIDDITVRESENKSFPMDSLHFSERRQTTEKRVVIY